MTRKSIPLELFTLCGASFKKDLISVESIHHIACQYYDIPYNKIFLKRDRKNYIAIQVRQMVIYAARLFTTNTVITLGVYCRRDHGQIIHATKMALKRMNQSEAYNDGLVRIIEKINTKISSTIV